jgi:general nucleoside transport system permease protein
MRKLIALGTPLGSVALALVIGGVVMAVAQHSVQAPFNGYWALLVGAFGTPYDVSETLVSATPLIFAALAVAFAFRGGLFNIGVEGQLYVGAIASTFVGYSLHWPGWLLLPLCCLVGLLAGGLWAAAPAILKAYRGAHEVITTMMLNYVALDLMHYLLDSQPSGAPGPMGGLMPGTNASAFVNAVFPVIVPAWLVSNPPPRLSAAIVLALACGIVFWFLLFRTTLGYGIRAAGFNLKAARYAGINLNRTIILTMLVSGGFAGLAGTVCVFGLSHQLVDGFDGFALGFDAIVVALLGRNTAVGAILAAILFGALDHGSALMQTSAGVNISIIQIIQGLIIFFIGAEAIFHYLGRSGFLAARSSRIEPNVPAERALL